MAPPHLSVLTFDALGYFLDATLVQGKIQRMSIRDGYEMANNHIVHDFFLSFQVDQNLVSSCRGFLSIFSNASRATISDHKNDYWLIGIDGSPIWIPLAWTLFHPCVIVRYIRIPFGMGLSPKTM